LYATKSFSAVAFSKTCFIFKQKPKKSFFFLFLFQGFQALESDNSFRKSQTHRKMGTESHGSLAESRVALL